jgi:hypothetical protein
VLPTDHHDYIEFAGGRTLVSYPIKDNVVGLFSGSKMYADGVLEEQDTNGNPLWTWTASDHFAPAESTFPVNFGVPPNQIADFPDAWDVSHINAVDRMPDGDYLVTARHLDAVFRVDRSSATGSIDWVLGGPAPSGITPLPGRPAPLTVVGDPYGGPKRPHDARLDGDVLTMFDNQTGTGRFPRAVAYRINVGAGTATMLWEIRNSVIGGATLGSVRQAGDSVLVGWGAGLQPMIEEFAWDGTRFTRVMAIGQRDSGSSYRTVKYPPSDFDVNVLRANAGGTAQPPP